MSSRASSPSPPSASWSTMKRAPSSRAAARPHCATAARTRAWRRSSTGDRWRPDMALTTATNHWKLGLFVVVALLTMVAATFWLGSRAFRRKSVAVVSYFDESVQGLDVGSPVKFRGVTIGTVGDITLAPDHRNVQVTSDIYVDALKRLGLEVPKKGGQPLDPSLRVQLVSAGITGVRFLQTDFFDPERYPPPALSFPPPWNYLPSTPSTLKSLEDAAVEIVDKLPHLEDVANVTLSDLRHTLG